MQSNLEYGSSVFNAPLEQRSDGSSRSLYPDTSDKHINFENSANLSKYFGISRNASLGLCRNADDREELVPGEDSNPAIVKIGSGPPAIVQFCARSEDERQFCYVRIRDLSCNTGPEGFDYDGNIPGLNFKLGTCTIDIPAFSPVVAKSEGEFVNGIFVTARSDIEIIATPQAQEGVHNFVVEFTDMPGTDPAAEGRFNHSKAVYVRVAR